MRLDNNSPERQPAQENVSQAQVKKQVHHLGTIRPHEGHTLWEYNINSGEIVPAQFDGKTTVDFPLDGNPVIINKRVIVKEGYIYMTALNKTNALRKIEKTYADAEKTYNANYKVINGYLAAAVSRWFDWAEKNGDQVKRSKLLEKLDADWKRWIYQMSPVLKTYYSHLFIERWGQTMQLVANGQNTVEK